jgi:phosphopantothenoylcysteine decarboxylase / phosphopantothenate---cysteine ligase
VAFAAETAELDEAVAHGHAKLLRKRADLIVVNQVGIDRTFGADRNAAVILSADGERETFPEAAKDDLADRILDLVARRLA